MFLGSKLEADFVRRMTQVILAFRIENPDVSDRDIVLSLVSLTFSCAKRIGWSVFELSAYACEAWASQDASERKVVQLGNGVRR